jgi:hypothetical protein
MGLPLIEGKESPINTLLAHELLFVADRKFMSALCASAGQHFASVLGRHTSAKAMLIDAFAAARLVSSFHSAPSLL